MIYTNVKGLYLLLNNENIMQIALFFKPKTSDAFRPRFSGLVDFFTASPQG